MPGTGGRRGPFALRRTAALASEARPIACAGRGSGWGDAGFTVRVFCRSAPVSQSSSGKGWGVFSQKNERGSPVRFHGARGVYNE